MATHRAPGCRLNFVVGPRCANSRSLTSPTVIELMYSLKPAPTGAPSPAARMDLLRRRPQRIFSTVNWHLHQRLQQRADEEGRSLSGLIVYILERSTAA